MITTSIAVSVAILWVGVSPLQAQVDATPTGGTLQLEAQTYLGELVLDRAMTIRGRGVTETRIEGSEGTVVTVRASKGGEIVLERLTVTGGGKPTKVERLTREGGGFHIEEGAKVRLVDVAVRDNHAVSGAGIWVKGELRGKTITLQGNRGNDGSALRGYPGAVVELEDAMIQNNGAVGAQVQFFGQVLVLRRVEVKDARPSGPTKGAHFSLFGVGPVAPQVLLQQVTIGASSGSPVLVGAGRGAAAPVITLIDTTWPAGAEVPEGWEPTIQKPQAGEAALR